jgi:KDO2-lipid IV(A) lauroyltransferase
MPGMVTAFLCGLLGRLAADTADRVGGTLGVLAWRLGIRRAHCTRLVAECLGLRGAARARVLRRAYATMGANFLAVWTIGGPDGPERHLRPLNPRWLAALHRAGRGGRGLVTITPHLGSWDAGALALQALVGPVLAYAKPQHDPAVDTLLNARRSATGVQILITHRGDRTEAVRVLRALRSGGVAGLIADQRPYTEDAEAAWFLGRPAWCHPGAGFFAAKARVQVAAGCCLRERAGRFVFFVGRPRDGVGTQQAMDLLSALIAAVPGQYFWMHHRFKAVPERLPPRSGPWPVPLRTVIGG